MGHPSLLPASILNVTHTPSTRHPDAPLHQNGNSTPEPSGLGVRTARRIAVAVAGATVVLVGVALLVLPGPGVVTILVGLGILSMEFAFARKWIVYIKARSSQVADGAGVPRRWRWAFPVMAIVVGITAMLVPLFVAVVHTPTGLRVLPKPSASYRYTLTSAQTLQAQALEGDAFAAALLERCQTSPANPQP